MKHMSWCKCFSNIFLLISFGMVFISKPCIGQINLVHDGGFEKYRFCPRGITFWGTIGLVHWSLPTAGTTDYYNRCCRNSICGVPQNYFGSIEPVKGSGYIGMILYNKRFGRKNYREYIQCQLVNKLSEDTVYFFRTSIALASKSQFSINSFGVAFNQDLIDRPRFQRVLTTSPVIDFNISQIAETDAWVEISGYFIAAGNEATIVLGNFNKDKVMRIIRRPQNQIFSLAYYYLDDVLLCTASSLHHNVDSLVLARTTKNNNNYSENAISDQFTKKDTLITLQIAFKCNSAIITDSLLILDLAEFIKQNHADSLLIIGHTYETDNEVNNLNLSLEQARSVQNALLDLSPGIISEVYGMGSSRPLANEAASEDREENQRVEIYLKLP